MFKGTLLFISFIICVLHSYGNTVVLSPQTLDEWENESATLNCSYEGQYEQSMGYVYWYYTNQTSIYTAQMQYNNNACTVTHGWLSNSDHYAYNCTNKNVFYLTLKRLSRQTQGGQWVCVYSPGTVQFKSNTVPISLKVPVQITTIYPYNDTFTTAENSTVSLQCVTFQVRPKAYFQWYLDNDTITGEEKMDKTNDMSSNLISNYSTTSKFQLNRKWNSRYLYCGASNRNNVYILSKKIFVNVTYPPDGPPRIGRQINGSEINVIKGRLLTLNCTVTIANPPPRLEWNKNNDQPQSETGGTVIKQIWWLPNDFIEEDLICRAFHQGKSDKTYVTVNVLYPPAHVVIYLQNETGMFVNVVKSISVIEGRSFTLNCWAESNPPVSIYEWSGLIPCNCSILHAPDGIQRNQSGNITCKVINIMQPTEPRVTEYGYNSSSVTVDVLYPPKVNQLKDKTLAEGDNFVYSCNATPGNPSISVFTWKRGAKKWDTQHLDFKNVSRNQSGTYACIVSNLMSPSDGNASNGTGIGEFHLTVQYKAKVRIFVMEDHEANLRVSVNENETVTLACEIEGNPLPDGEVFVQNADYLLQSQLNITNVSSESTEVLHLRTTLIAQCFHSGTFTCVGNNTMYTGEEYMSTKTMTLTVNCKPRKSPFHEIRDTVVSPTSVPTTITFATLAYPIPPTSGYVWSRNTKATMHIWIKIENYDTSYTIETSGLQSDLIIKNVSQFDFGLYRVEVRNDFGSYTHTFKLDPGGKPEAPMQLECIDDLSNETSATLQWMPGFNGGFDQTFFLMLKTVDGDIWHEENIPDQKSSKMNHSFNGLVVGTIYIFEMYSSNKLGNSSSVKITFTTRTRQSSEKGQQSTSSNGTPVGSAVGGTIAALVILVILIVSGIFYKMRSQSVKPPIPRRLCHFNNHLRQILNREGAKTQANGVQRMLTSAKVHVCPSDSQEILLETTLNRRTTYPQSCDNDEKQVYNDYGNSQTITKTIERIYVSELFDYLTDKAPENLEAEYMKLPRGFTMPYAVSQIPGNIGLNRYNDICPYDHSRVTIEGEPDFYINASYINGYEKKNTYIAALGPMSKTTNNFAMFWQMVWSEKSDIIVMLTRLNEPSGVKCEQYWPQEGKSVTYGDITLASNVEHIYSEYVLRKFTISKGNEVRNLNQFHFMAWPDKSVPENVTCFLEFRRQWKKYHLVGPMIVHCSAGIGRTGTLIAIDLLIEEGNHKGSVNVLQCVKTLRDQRVNMVQTLEQYYYIYTALVNALVLGAESTGKAKFHDYADQKRINVKDMFRKLNLSVEKDTIEENKARILNMRHRENNRIGADIPGEAYIVRLCRKQETGMSDYINAVYVNSFTRKNHFIVAQSPLITGVEDFLCLIYQTDCTCIVSMEGVNESKAAAVYYPTNDSSLTVGRFKIKGSMLETNESYEVRILNIELTGQTNCTEKTVYHFQYKGWMDRLKVPSDAQTFVEFATEVEDFARQLGTADSKVLVHCLTAYERSCLFCAVVVLIEKIQHEGEVCIPNTLRNIRTRRKLAFPNKIKNLEVRPVIKLSNRLINTDESQKMTKGTEQLQFCFQAVNAYINIGTGETNNAENTYENVSVQQNR